MIKIASVGLVVLALGFVTPVRAQPSVAAAPPPSRYHLLETMTTLPGIARWDYLIDDADSHRLFITHGDHVDVFDTDKQQLAGTIGNLQGIHGVTLAPAYRRGFISDGKANAVVIFDMTTLKTTGNIPVGQKPDAIAYDTASRQVYAANGDSDSLSVIDPQNEKVTATIPLGGGPEFIATDGKGRLYVNIEDKSQMAVIDTAKNMVIARYELAPSCEKPSGLAIDRGAGRLFAVCQNRTMAVVDGRTGKILATPQIGNHPDAAAYDDGTGLAFSSNGDGTFSVIGEDKPGHYVTLQTVQTRPGARTMALDPASHKIYLVTAEPDGTIAGTVGHPGRPHFKDNTVMLIAVTP